MRITKKIQVEVPIGKYAVVFNLVWGAACNPGKHTDCLDHGCLDNEPSYVQDVDGIATKITRKNYPELGVEGLSVDSHTGEKYDDTHDFRTRIFNTKKEALEHLEYTLNRFKNPQPWESFIKY